MKQSVIFQRIEAGFVFVASLYFYLHLGYNILIFILLLFTVDIFMLGYVKNNKVGALIYNIGHSLIIPAVLIVIGVMSSSNPILAVGLIWLAHAGWDRVFGYGLKYDSGFKHTHLGNLGKDKAKN